MQYSEKSSQCWGEKGGGQLGSRSQTAVRIKILWGWKLLPLSFHMAGKFGSALFPFWNVRFSRFEGQWMGECSMLAMSILLFGLGNLSQCESHTCGGHRYLSFPQAAQRTALGLRCQKKVSWVFLFSLCLLHSLLDIGVWHFSQISLFHFHRNVLVRV